ncbi:hypothetical protein [Streptomyces exfoliatus]|uniref:hypothetical protein n=1 Tax=Streptomyces exfoliatus TaxID=1905 RepID=UPI00324881A5
MTPKRLLADWPTWAGPAALLWSLLYATGATLAALGAISTGLADHAPWVVAVAYGGFP